MDKNMNLKMPGIYTVFSISTRDDVLYPWEDVSTYYLSFIIWFWIDAGSVPGYYSTNSLFLEDTALG